MNQNLHAAWRLPSRFSPLPNTAAFPLPCHAPWSTRTNTNQAEDILPPRPPAVSVLKTRPGRRSSPDISVRVNPNPSSSRLHLLLHSAPRRAAPRPAPPRPLVLLRSGAAALALPPLHRRWARGGACADRAPRGLTCEICNRDGSPVSFLMKISKGRKKMRNKQRKSSALSFDAGRGSLSCILWSLMGFGLVVCFFFFKHQADSGQTRIYSSNLPATRELEDIEEDHFRLPPPHKVNPRAVKRRGPRKQRKIVDDYLEESSAVHALFFPDKRTAVDPTKGGNDSMYFYPGRVWLDTDGNPIQAHGGGVMYDDKTAKFYWYGENKDGPTYQAHPKGTQRVDIIGVSCYSSKDLWSWTHEGIVLPGEPTNVTHDLHKSKVLERPKVIYNDRTGKYVMWMHIDDANYTKASVGVAVSNSPTGPFTYLYRFRPHGFESRDMTVFKDDDGTAYLFYSSRDNTELHVSPLTEDYLHITAAMKRILIRRHREAPAVFKHQETYYMITSGCSGWDPNRALAHAADSIMGPWETLGNPCVGGNRFYRLTTFLSQSTFVLPLPGLPGTFIFMADRWSPSNLRDSRYVWLPLFIGGLADEPLDYSFGFPLWSRVSIYWHKKWRLPEDWRLRYTQYSSPLQ